MWKHERKKAHINCIIIGKWFLDNYLSESSQCFALTYSGICRKIPSAMRAIHLALMLEVEQIKLICNTQINDSIEIPANYRFPRLLCMLTSKPKSTTNNFCSHWSSGLPGLTTKANQNLCTLTIWALLWRTALRANEKKDGDDTIELKEI